MAYIDWKDDFSVNIKQFDNEHKNIVNMLNSLHEAMKLGKGRDSLAPLFDKSLNYAKEHFVNEEKLMQKSAYPDFEAHRKEHLKFISCIDDFKKEVNTPQGVLLSSKVMNFLKDWLINHIGKMDKGYSKHMNSKGIF